MSPITTPEALFVGLCTLDVIQSVDRVPATNEKITAARQTVAAGVTTRQVQRFIDASGRVAEGVELSRLLDHGGDTDRTSAAAPYSAGKMSE